MSSRVTGYNLSFILNTQAFNLALPGWRSRAGTLLAPLGASAYSADKLEHLYFYYKPN